MPASASRALLRKSPIWLADVSTSTSTRAGGAFSKAGVHRRPMAVTGAEPPSRRKLSTNETFTAGGVAAAGRSPLAAKMADGIAMATTMHETTMPVTT